jgi:hypothetical protein
MPYHRDIACKPIAYLSVSDVFRYNQVQVVQAMGAARLPARDVCSVCNQSRWYTNPALHGANYVLDYMSHVHTRDTTGIRHSLRISLHLETYTHFQASGFL